MIHIYPAKSRSSVDLGWLTSHRSFSFGDYYDPDNTSFGVMRVCNDDDIAAGRGFGPHPHSDMEIVTIVLRGHIKHEDSLGHAAVTGPNGVQRMSAGTGVIHAEYNASDTEDLSLLQLWFMPAERGREPSFENSVYNPELMRNALLAVVSPTGSDQAARIYQDMTIYLSRLDAGKKLEYLQEAGRKIFLFVIEGALHVNGLDMKAKDTARIEDTPELVLEAVEDAYLMLIDLP
ncbi:pirin family protein [Paenibacillus hexagrammi]|uniref:Pirin family protein n=1 Tax=Paenibacillus hexagrammi TaxID=2908839 RepID=A0ABY3SJG0_9BACL|nr:pirin family protein [Paenibacillus sp. YPD9-1]UJF34091.1 pirin family protein [Paenibacillus sp. YPD9-1]